MHQYSIYLVLEEYLIVVIELAVIEEGVGGKDKNHLDVVVGHKVILAELLHLPQKVIIRASGAAHQVPTLVLEVANGICCR